MIHRAMMREVDGIAAAVQRMSNLDRRTPARLRDWLRFVERTLHHHHRVEDALFFTTISARDPGFAAAHEALEAEHDVLNPLMRDVCNGLAKLADLDGDAWIAARASVRANAVQLAQVLREHLAHEEAELIPRAIVHLNRIEVKNVERKALRWIPTADVSLIVPWFLSRIDASEREQMLHRLSWGTRALNRLWWEPRFRRLAAPVLQA